MKNKVIGFTSGVFDLFHIGHLNILRRAREHCDYLIIGVSTDELVKEYKNKKPVIPLSERIEIVKAIRYVDEVLPLHTREKLYAWEKLKFNKIFVGDDWQGTEKWVIWEKQLKKLNVEVVYFPYTRHTSSTKLQHALNALINAQER